MVRGFKLIVAFYVVGSARLGQDVVAPYPHLAAALNEMNGDSYRLKHSRKTNQDQAID